MPFYSEFTPPPAKPDRLGMPQFKMLIHAAKADERRLAFPSIKKVCKRSVYLPVNQLFIENGEGDSVMVAGEQVSNRSACGGASVGWTDNARRP